MKLATALSERADLQQRLSNIESRLLANSKVQEGESPAEDPAALLAEKDGVIEQLESLIARINLTNSRVRSGDRTITELIAHRDCIRMDLRMMRNFLSSASQKIDRYSRTEIVIKSSVDVAELQKKVDLLSKELRQTDELIQELNWTTELI